MQENSNSYFNQYDIKTSSLLKYDNDIEYYQYSILSKNTQGLQGNQDKVKIYTGNTYSMRKKYTSNIEKLKIILGNSTHILQDINPSTLTVKGNLTNIGFNEEKLISMIGPPKNPFILSMGCNFGEILNTTSQYKKASPAKKTSNRGRKPKKKLLTKRKQQGSGKYFSSQITFEIYNPDVSQPQKTCKIKLFRNGNFQAPGVRNPDLTDIIKPVLYLRDYMREQLIDTTIDINYITPVMRNYTSFLPESNLVYINILEDKFKIEKELEPKNKKIIAYLTSIFTEKIALNIMGYTGIMFPIGLSEIQYNCERYFGLIVKFIRPVPWTDNKKTTIKFLRSGKINFDGGNSIEEIYELYYWLQCFYLKYKGDIIYNNLKNQINSDDSTSEFSSIYEDDSYSENEG